MNKANKSTMNDVEVAQAAVKAAFNPNRDAINPTACDEIPFSPPLGFWKNGNSKLKSLGASDVNFTGGLFISDDATGADVSIPGWVLASFEGESGKVVEGLASNLAHITVVRQRMRWFKDGPDGFEFRVKYAEGFRGHLQIIGFIKGYEFPVAFSFKGYACSNVRAILTEHARKVLAVANRNFSSPAQKLPQYAFYISIEPGEHEKVGQGQKQSEVTLPRIVLPKVVDDAYLIETYIGDGDPMKAAQELWMEAEKWAHEWDSFEKEASTAVATPQQLAIAAQAPIGNESDVPGSIPF